MRYRVFPDHLEPAAGSEPSLGPITARSARDAYWLALDQGLYPAGVCFGLRVVEDASSHDPSIPRCWSATREHLHHEAPFPAMHRAATFERRDDDGRRGKLAD